MDQVAEFFKKLFDSSDWPPRWHCGQWTEFHGWLYIISDLLIWSAYFTIPIVIIRNISKKQGIRFTRLYFLFAAFLLACGATHFLDAIAFWIPAYRLSALVRFITGALSWLTVFYLIKLLPAAFSLKSQKELETDIEQRKKAEEQVRESEGQIQTIFDAAPDAVIVIDESGKIVKWNPKAEAMFGWKENEVTGKLLSETIIPERFREKHTKGMQHFLRTGEGPLFGKIVEISAVTKDNTELDVALNIAATKKIKDRYLFIGFVRDITEQRKAELQIQKQKQDIQDFMDSMSTLSVKLATDGKILMVNKIALQASGLSMEELLRTNFTEGPWWTFDPEVHSRVRDAFNKACSGITINYDENIFVFDQVLTIDFSLIPILNQDGSVDYIVGEGRDITAQKKTEERIKESEEKLSILFNSIDEGFCIIQMIFDEHKKPVDYLFLVVNPSFEKQTGLRNAAGKRMREFAPNHEEHWFETYGNIALTGESIRFENRAEQLHRWYDVYAFRFGDPKNLQVAILFNDITDRKRTEESITQMNLELEKRVEEKTREIIQSEKKFRNLIENTADIISLTDKNFKTVYRSPSAERITGFTNKEREKLSGTELFHPDDLPGVQMAMEEILEGPHKQFHLSYRHRHKDGHYVWLEGMMTNMLHDKTIGAVLFNLRDITEAKKAEELVVQSEIKYRSLFENNPMPIWVIDASSFEFLDVNEAAIRHYGYSREEFLSMTALDIRPGSEKEKFLHQNLSADSNSYKPNIWKHLKKDNSIIYVEVIGHNINFDGKPARLVLSNDVTERIKMEEMLKESFKEISDYKYALDESSIVAITDQKGIIKYVNDNFCKISKYSREELIGQDHRIINSGYHPKEFIRRLWGTIANGKIWKGELKNKAKDGTIYWVDTTIVPFLDEKGKPYQYVAIRADITERKQAEQAFNESQRLLMAIIDNSTAVIYVKDLEGRYLLVNRRFSDLFHRNLEEVLGKTDYDFFPEEEADAFRQMDMRTAVAGHALTEEEKVLQDDGLHTYISVKSTLRDDKDKPYAIFGISTDISGVKEAEENLRKSLREVSDYKYALDESSIVAITDQKGIIKHANDNFCKISKYSREELIGQDHRIVNSGYHPKEFIRDLWVTIANGKIWKGELKNKAKDGTIYWVDTTIIPFLNEEGKPYQYVAIRADITGRKKLEEQQVLFGSIVNSSDDAILSKTLDGEIISWNRGAEKVFGYSSTEIMGKQISILIPPNLQNEENEMMEKIRKGQGVDHYETKRIRKDGQMIYVSLTVSPIRDSFGNIIGASKIARDVTDKKKSEDEIQKLNEELEHRVAVRTAELNSLNKEMEAFTYSVSHDLRAPLRGIVGFTSILEEDYASQLDDEAKRITSVIRNNTLRMGRLVDDLLAFSRTGKQELIKTKINAQAMVGEIVDDLLLQNEKGNIISWDIQALPDMKGDLNTIRQVWINLISNAIKYSSTRNHPHIEIGSKQEDGQVVFYVKDNGVGFDENYKHKLFKVFQRLHRADEFEGTGVGLALVEKIVSRHGGKVWAESREDEGACFFFSLPA